jgi:hypothetical protein
LAWIRDALAQIEAASFLFFLGYEVAAFAQKNKKIERIAGNSS